MLWQICISNCIIEHSLQQMIKSENTLWMSNKKRRSGIERGGWGGGIMVWKKVWMHKKDNSMCIAKWCRLHSKCIPHECYRFRLYMIRLSHPTNQPTACQNRLLTQTLTYVKEEQSLSAALNRTYLGLKLGADKLELYSYTLIFKGGAKQSVSYTLIPCVTPRNIYMLFSWR